MREALEREEEEPPSSPEGGEMPRPRRPQQGGHVTAAPQAPREPWPATVLPFLLPRSRLFPRVYL